MEPQEVEFTSVCNRIKQCILGGQTPPGSALPPSEMYREQPHVNRYMTDRVFDVLRAEGLVGIQPHLAPIVVSKKGSCNSSNTIFETLKQGENTLQLYQTFALILSSLMASFSQGCGVETIPHYKQAMKTLCLRDTSGE